MKHRNLLLSLFAVLPLLSMSEEKPQLVINEIMVANVDQFVDPSWNFGPWAEIYNAGETEVNLRGCWVSDDPSRPMKIRIPRDLTVPAGGFATLWFDHHDKYNLLQLPLKLDADGGTLLLSSPRGSQLALFEYPPCIPRASYARMADGQEEWQWSSTPTPGASNQGMTFCQERLPAPEVNKPSCIFSGTLNVMVAIPKGCTLRYTTDGRTPTLAHGKTSSEGLFSIRTTQILRFALFRDGYLSSPVVTRSYLLRDKTFSLPVVSVVTDPDNLYSDEMGIFVRGTNGRPGHGEEVNCNWNMEWDRPCNFELLDAEGHSLVNQETLIRRSGGWSRAWTPYSFKIKAVKTAEFQNRLDYPFFEGKPYLRHKTLQIRNGGNDNEVRIKDPFFQQIVGTSGLDIDYQEYLPVAHYINGVYRGVINMREPNNKHHVYANYGLDEEEIDLFEMDSDSGYVQQCGTEKAWKNLVSNSRYCKSDAIYERIEKMLDIDEYCNYMSVGFYGGNIDWPYNNVKAFRPIQDGGCFRFILYDVDKCFRTDTPFTRFESQNIHQFGLLYGEPVERYTLEVEVVTLFLNMLRNDKFRKHFIDTFCLVTGSVFEPKRCQEIINRLVARIADMQVLNDNGYGQNKDPMPEARDMINSLNRRQDLMMGQLKAFPQMKLQGAKEQTVSLRGSHPAVCIQVNGQVVPTGEFLGTLFPPITLKASAPDGYRFVGWANQEKQGTGPLKIIGFQPEMELPSSTAQLNLVAVFENETEEDMPGKVVINEVSAGNSIYVNEYFKKADWIELYNTGSEDIDLAGMYLSDDPAEPLKCQILPGNEGISTILPAYGRRIVWCDGRESISQLHVNFKLANEDQALVMLTAQDQSWADTLVYCAHDGLQTVGRFPDGGQELFLMSKPSIEKKNIMNRYTTRWEPGMSGSGLDSTGARSGGLSLTYASGSLYVKSEEDSRVRLSVCDLSGMEQKRFHLQLEGWHQCVPVGDLSEGIYVARLEDSQGNACTVKFRK